MLEKRVFFAFMPSLLPGDEGVRAWRFFPSPQDQIDRLVGFVTEDLGLRTFGAFYPTDNYGPRMTGLLDQKLAGMGITLHSASYTPGQSSTWSGQAATLINPTAQENITAPIPPDAVRSALPARLLEEHEPADHQPDVQRRGTVSCCWAPPCGNRA